MNTKDRSSNLTKYSKPKTRQRGVSSPDRADAAFGAMTPIRQIRSFNLIDRTYGDGRQDGFGGEWGNSDDFKPPLPGAWCG